MSDPRLLHVLLLEDNPLDVFLVEALLGRLVQAQVQLHHAERLRAALRILQEDPIDLVLTDLSLPDCHGIDTVGILLRHAGQIPVVVLTGCDDPAIEPHVLEEGARACFCKDHLTVPAFATIVDEVFQRKDATAPS